MVWSIETCWLPVETPPQPVAIATPSGAENRSFRAAGSGSPPISTSASTLIE
jgi:hypothetical protein